MARHGVTYQDIVNAINQLKGQEKSLTIENIRSVLGTGSSTTIANHLRQWRRDPDSNSSSLKEESLPHEFIALMKGLWERLVFDANEKVVVIEKQSQDMLILINQEFDTLKNSYALAQQALDDFKKEMQTLESVNAHLLEELNLVKTDNATLKTAQLANEQRLTEKQTHIDELIRQNTQTQLNLEHYREAAREQRLHDLEQFEQQRQEFQSQQENLKMQLREFSEKLQIMGKENVVLQDKNNFLDKELQKAIHAQQLLQEKNNTDTKLLDNLRNENSALIAMKNSMEIKLNDLVLTNKDLQSEIKLLSQQSKTNHEAISKLQEENKQLTLDKWKLVTEKAQLEGQVAQLSKGFTLDKSVVA